MIRRARLGALLLGGGLALCAALPARAETKIVEGYVSPGAPEWAEYVGLAFGWFKDNGIALDMVAVGAVDAVIAERYGRVNRTLDDDDLDSFVDALVRRLASFDREALAG
jgi:ABC-type nitrate/sulfonate/bicarbonate transport system substrate-binding protein